MSERLLIRGGRVVDPSQKLDDVRDLLLEGGKVARLEPAIDLGELGEGVEVIEAAGKVVTPGLIDIHVHLREPGQEYKEDVESGTRAAAAGGFTAVACMANTRPVNDGRAVTEHILAQTQRHGYARVYPVGAITKGMAGEELAEFGEMVRAGAVGVSDDGLPVANPELMRRAFLYAQHYDIPVIQHAEDLQLTGEGVMHEGVWSTRLGLPGIPSLAEDVTVQRDLLLAEETGGRYHLQHLSSGRSLDLMREARRRGVNATCEVSAHHLLLTDESIHTHLFDTSFKMKPPLRSAADREALVEGLRDGSIDVIASDHAPHHPDEKDVEFSVAPYGVLGLETTVSLCLDRLVKPGIITLSRLVDLLSTRAAQVMGIPGGSLAVGQPADVTLLDLEQPVTVDASTFESKSRNTPFHGWTLTGAPAGTILAGRKIQL